MLYYKKLYKLVSFNEIINKLSFDIPPTTTFKWQWDVTAFYIMGWNDNKLYKKTPKTYLWTASPIPEHFPSACWLSQRGHHTHLLIHPLLMRRLPILLKHLVQQKHHMENLQEKKRNFGFATQNHFIWFKPHQKLANINSFSINKTCRSMWSLSISIQITVICRLSVFWHIW